MRLLCLCLTGFSRSGFLRKFNSRNRAPEQGKSADGLACGDVCHVLDQIRPGCLWSLVGGHLRRLHAGLVGLARFSRDAAGSARRGRSTGSARYSGGCSLQSRLVRRVEESTAIRSRIVDELPLIVVIFLIKYADAFISADTGYTDHRTAAEDLSARARAPLSRRAESAGGARTAGTGRCRDAWALVGRRNSGCFAVRIFI